jgi:hypothetical protein
MDGLKYDNGPSQRSYRVRPNKLCLVLKQTSPASREGTVPGQKQQRGHLQIDA